MSKEEYSQAPDQFKNWLSENSRLLSYFDFTYQIPKSLVPGGFESQASILITKFVSHKLNSDMDQKHIFVIGALPNSGKKYTSQKVFNVFVQNLNQVETLHWVDVEQEVEKSVNKDEIVESMLNFGEEVTDEYELRVLLENLKRGSGPDPRRFLLVVRARILNHIDNFLKLEDNDKTLIVTVPMGTALIGESILLNWRPYGDDIADTIKQMSPDTYVAAMGLGRGPGLHAHQLVRDMMVNKIAQGGSGLSGSQAQVNFAQDLNKSLVFLAQEALPLPIKNLYELFDPSKEYPTREIVSLIEDKQIQLLAKQTIEENRRLKLRSSDKIALLDFWCDLAALYLIGQNLDSADIKGMFLNNPKI